MSRASSEGRMGIKDFGKRDTDAMATDKCDKMWSRELVVVRSQKKFALWRRVGEIVLIVLLAASVSGCGNGGAHTVSHDAMLLGTWVRFTVAGVDSNHAHGSIERAIDQMKRVEDACSFHDPNSELSRLNRLAATEAVVVSECLWSVACHAIRAASETDGAFDPTVGPLVHLWGIGSASEHIPKPEEISEVLPLVSYQNVEMDESNRSIRFLKPGMRLDFGGIAKGYAVDCAVASMRDDGIESALIQAGGSIGAIGRKQPSRPWRVGIQHPRASTSFHVFPLENLSVATSGDYQIFFERQGARYHHLLNPQTGMPIQGALSVTVTAKQGVIADAYSTAIMVWAEKNQTIKKKIELVAREKGIGIVIVLCDGSVLSAGAWEQLPERLDLPDADQ